jgi:hypothetical protein
LDQFPAALSISMAIHPDHAVTSAGSAIPTRERSRCSMPSPVTTSIVAVSNQWLKPTPGRSLEHQLSTLCIAVRGGSVELDGEMSAGRGPEHDAFREPLIWTEPRYLAGCDHCFHDSQRFFAIQTRTSLRNLCGSPLHSLDHQLAQRGGKRSSHSSTSLQVDAHLQ